MEIISTILTHLFAAGAGAFIMLAIVETTKRDEFKYWIKQQIKNISKN